MRFAKSYSNSRKGFIFSFLIVLFLISNIQTSRADHNAGGELTWECKPNGRFVFTLKLYRYCEGINLPATASIQSNSPASSISMTRVVSRDISPKCYDSTQWMNCYGTNSGFTIEENIYISGDIQLNSVPPASGWHFYWSSCCRPAPALYMWGNLVDNLEPQNQSYRIKASMYPYNGQNAYPCYDNSPTFAATPTTIICTGYPFTYNHNAVDKDLDSLTFTWTSPLLSNGNPVTYATHTNTSQVTPRANGGGFIVPAPGFSATRPLPWSHSNMNVNNVPATMDLYTGEINFTSFTKGQYATAVLVTSYRCGVKISEIMRDIPVTLLTCPPTPTVPPLSNTPPQVTFKWFPGSPTTLPLPAGDTVWAGDSVEFYITSTDIQFLPGFIGQTNYLIPRGSQFGTGFASTTAGCLYPPCATMDTTSVYFNHVDQWWEGQFGIAASFKWKTSCNHLNYVDSCFTRSNKYNFVFRILDDWCPAPGANFQTFTVTVLAPPALPPPRLKCSQVLANGDVQLHWDQPVAKQDDSLFSFRKYIVYRSDSSIYGPFDTLHVVLDIDSLEYLDATANAISSPKYYVIHGISSCNDQGVLIWSDTLSSMIMNVQKYNAGSSVALNWNEFNPGNNFGNTTTGKYYVWQVANGDTILVDSTTNNWDSLDVFLCYPTVAEYYVTVEDTTLNFGCTSISNVVSDTVGDVIPPPTIALDTVSHDALNDVFLGWQPTSTDIATYYIYRNGILIDSLPGSLNAYSYTRNLTDSCLLSFGIGARDTCGNASSPGAGQDAMCVEIVDVIRCDTNKNIKIAWNTYNPAWSNGAGVQFVYRSVNGGPFVLVDSVSALTTQYVDTNITGNTTYAYRIRSWEMGKSRGAWSTVASYALGKIITGTVVPEPDFTCVSWLNDTTLSLKWNRPANPDSNFNRYLIYHSFSSNASTFSVIDSIDGVFTSDNKAWDTNHYEYVVSDPDTSHFFYLMSSSGCDGLQLSPKSRNLSPIYLDITSISDSVNRLSWTKTSNTQLGNLYYILRDGLTWQVSPYGTENIQDKLITCSDSMEYQILFPSGGVNGCTSESKKEYGYFKDDTPPAKLFIDSVSMLRDSSMTAVVGWSPGISKDIMNYIVTKCSPGSPSILDTLPSTSGFYSDASNAPLLQVTEYSVSGVDSCGNSGFNLGKLDCHRTIFLNSSVDRCNHTVKLNWNAYDDFASGDQVLYKIFLSRDQGPFVFNTSTMESQSTIENLQEGSHYCFYVQAWENNGAGPFSSSSALECLRYESIKSPDFANLTFATVHDSNTVRLCMKIDQESDLGEYWIRRSPDKNKYFDIIASVVVPDPLTPSDSVFCFEDHPVDADERSFYYYIDVTDPCGNTTASTNHGRTIYLEVEIDRESNVNALTWNMYSDWQGGVEKYHIYRQSGKGTLSRIETLNAATLSSTPNVHVRDEWITYNDNVSREFNTGNGEFCYYVQAVEGQNTFHNQEAATSESNIVCAIQAPLVYAPNSFTPNGDGLNDSFMPAIAFHDLKSFQMIIFNRWGEQIYETKEAKGKGWDGKVNGKPAPVGAYVYMVKFSSVDGQEFEEKGSVTLSR